MHVTPLLKAIFLIPTAPTLAFVGLPWKSVRFPQFELQVRNLLRASYACHAMQCMSGCMLEYHTWRLCTLHALYMHTESDSSICLVAFVPANATAGPMHNTCSIRGLVCVIDDMLFQ